MKMRSPPCSEPGACQKWLKPTSYSVAADWKDAMWPPSSEDSALARRTMAIAFQRTSARILCSIAWSPGTSASAEAGSVLTYGVLSPAGIWTP